MHTRTRSNRADKLVLLFLTAFTLSSALPVAALAAPGQQARLGKIEGVVRDKATQQPLPAASVLVLGTERGAATNLAGRFTISDLPVGTYRLRASMIGYKSQVRTDVVVSTGHTASAAFELVEESISGKEVTIQPDYFYKEPATSTSSQTFDNEEIRRSPGGAEDISRVMMSMPGAASSSDQLNNLIVRGGTPIENLTIWDGVELPNSNHFGEMGETGGPIGMIDIKMVQEAEFYTGGFPAKYGDKLSSVLDLTLREGNRQRFSSDLDLNMAGAGGLIEGPLAQGRGAWMASYRKSYLDLIKGGLGLTAVPHYSDSQGKLVYDLASKHRLSLVWIGGIDRIKIVDDKGSGYTRGGRVDYVEEKTLQYGVGLNCRSLLGQKGYSVLTLSTVRNNFFVDVRDKVDAMVYKNSSWEQETTLKGEVNYRLASRHQAIAGFSLKQPAFRHNIRSKDWESYSSDLGRTIVFPGLDVHERIDAHKSGAFVHDTWSQGRIAVKGGLRYDRFTLTGASVFSPRLAGSYSIAPNVTANVSYGRFSQTPPPAWLTEDPANRRLANMRSDHYVAGCEWLIRDSVRFSAEVYAKEHRDYPVERDDSTRVLVSEGRGYARGIDLFLQKKLTGRSYGLASYSYSRSRAWTPEKGWFDWDFDYRGVLTLVVGYIPSNRWEFSGKWRYMGGRPYTPIIGRELLSTGEWDPIYDSWHPNSRRHPPYHRLDLRFDHRSHYKGWNLITYLEIWNVYNRKNVWGYNWDRDTGERDEIYQFNFFPVGGFRAEF